MEAELYHVGGGQTDIKKPVVAFRNYKVPKTVTVSNVA